MKKTVFISSTYRDLQPHRKQIWKVLQNFDINVTGMEEFGARQSTPLETCLKEIEESQIYIGIISMCYGSVDDMTGKSYTQLEYDRARELGLDILIYLIDENQGVIKTGSVDFGDKQLSLNNFKKILKANHTIDFYIDEVDLGHKIYRNLEKRLSQPGYVMKRPDELDCKLKRITIGNSEWIIFVGYLNGKPFEIISGLVDDEEGLMLPKTVVDGILTKRVEKDEPRESIDFTFNNKRGYKTTIEGVDDIFDHHISNHDKMISYLLQSNVHIKNIIDITKYMNVDNEEYATWNKKIQDVLLNM